MNRKTLVFLLAILNFTGFAATAALLGTAFTYQGRLTAGANAANGPYDLTFTLYDAMTIGRAVAGPLTNAVTLSNGLFTATLDFGEGVFTGADRWLEIGVRPNGMTNDFTRLEPRQPVVPTPYALHAASATMLLSLSNAPLELTVGGQRALRLEPAAKSPNLLGGYEGNSIAPGVSGSVIAGGGTRRDTGGDNGGPEANVISASYGFIGSGYGNEVAASSSAISGGTWNSLGPQGYLSFIGAGNGNTIESWLSAIPGGGGNSIGTLSYAGFIGGGANNQIGSGTDCGVIGGGLGNFIDGSPYSLIVGGRFNKLWSGSSDDTISGGQSNVVQEHAYGSTIAGGQNNLIAGDTSYGTIGGGVNNQAQGGAATVGGGSQNSSSGFAATVGGACETPAAMTMRWFRGAIRTRPAASTASPQVAAPKPSTTARSSGATAPAPMSPRPTPTPGRCGPVEE